MLLAIHSWLQDCQLKHWQGVSNLSITTSKVQTASGASPCRRLCQALGQCGKVVLWSWEGTPSTLTTVGKDATATSQLSVPHIQICAEPLQDTLHVNIWWAVAHSMLSNAMCLLKWADWYIFYRLTTEVCFQVNQVLHSCIGSAEWEMQSCHTGCLPQLANVPGSRAYGKSKDRQNDLWLANTHVHTPRCSAF